MKIFKAEIKRMRILLEKEDVIRKRKRELFEAEIEEKELKIKDLLKKQLIKPGDKSDYINWLKGYIQKGGSVSHYYDYSFHNKIYIVVKDCQIPDLFGATSCMFIVPKGINVSPEKDNLNFEYGCNDIYLMDGFRHIGSWVPAYQDF